MEVAEQEFEDLSRAEGDRKGGRMPPQRPLTAVLELADGACRKIPPLWGLESFVAVNPFWGMRELPFADAIANLRAVTNECGFPPRGFFLEKLTRGELTEHEVADALEHLRPRYPALRESTAALVIAALQKEDASGSRAPTTLLQLLDLKLGGRYAELTHAELSRFLALYFDRGQAAIPSTLSHLPLFDAWLEFAATDRTLAFSGLRGAGSFFQRLFGNGSAAVWGGVSDAVNLDDRALSLLFFTELFSCRGWAAYLQHLDFEEAKQGGRGERVRNLLAIRCAYTLFGLQGYQGRFQSLEIPAWVESRRALTERDDWLPQLVCQTALELRFKTRVRRSFLSPFPEQRRERPKLQAMFCIDVRSEGIRRHLEALSPAIETYGFAGFFGLSFGYSEAGARSACEQYPVLLQRRFKVQEIVSPAHPTAIPPLDRARHSLALFVRILRQSVCSGFSYVESLGILYGAKMMKQVLARKRSLPPRGVTTRPTELLVELSQEEKIGAAHAILKNSSLSHPLAPIVLICGHRGCVTNNPYAAALDCGACGGHSGESNARVAVALLNDPAVRAGLIAHGISIPSDTRFVAAVHVTTSEEVELLDGSPAAHTRELLGEVRAWLDAASARSRAQLALSLSGLELTNSLREQMMKRSADWSELRPEWALARNGGFIAARRARTRGVNLENRCFLHEYDASADHDSSVLELIMTAPMIVASWINLQYYGSTVMPNSFGSGNKTIHNVVGQLGTVLGNGGDLKLGLPFQSVHTGAEPFHEPLRLQVVLEASTERIDAVIAKHRLLQELIDNEWLSISALSTTDDTLLTRSSPGTWT